MALPSLTLEAAGAELSDRMQNQNQTDFLFPCLHFKCKNKQTNKKYYYTIQLSMVIVSLENLKRRRELLIPKLPLTVRFKKPLEESFGL